MPPESDAAQRAPGREPVPGDVLGGRYEVQAELGRGGMATVYRGRDLRLQRRVAVKVFRGGFGEAVDPRRTTQEMRLLARVDHPSIVSVLDASTGDGVFGAFLVMELVTGDDLGALLHRARGPLSADFARRIVADVAGALQALHLQGVVHRDVKPANILIPAGASSPHSGVAAKLTDFGIAQLVDGARLTDPASILGTAAYLSPEQVRGAAPRPESDVYSLGLVLLEALTGRRAFPGPAAEAAMARLQRPPLLPVDASPALAELLSRMTALDPDHRPGAGEVSGALREQLAGGFTAPDAVQTAPTPISGIARLFSAAEATEATEDTRPHEATWTPSRGMPITTGAQPVAPRPAATRRRFPAVLAVTASVLATGVVAAAISAASIAAAPPDPGHEVAAHDGPAAGSEPIESPAAGPEDAGGVGVVDIRPPTSTPTPTPTPSATAATPSSSPTRSTEAPPKPEPDDLPDTTVPVLPVLPEAPTPATTTTPPPAGTDPAPVTPAPSEDPGDVGSDVTTDPQLLVGGEDPATTSA